MAESLPPERQTRTRTSPDIATDYRRLFSGDAGIAKAERWPLPSFPKATGAPLSTSDLAFVHDTPCLYHRPGVINSKEVWNLAVIGTIVDDDVSLLARL